MHSAPFFDKKCTLLGLSGCYIAIFFSLVTNIKREDLLATRGSRDDNVGDIYGGSSLLFLVIL